MKQHLPILVITLFLFSCYRTTEKVVSHFENGQPEWVIRYKSASDTLNKTIIGYYENGTKKSIQNLKDGFENGEQILYFPNGQTETICNKINGIQSGHSKTYFENGRLYAQGNFENDLRQGQWELFGKDGTKFIRNYHNDTLHGNTTETRTDGSIVYGQYINGQETGEWVTKLPDSTVTMITNYTNGMQHGSVKQFYKSSEIYLKGQYDNGKRQGDWEIYSRSGRIEQLKFTKMTR